MKIPSLDTIVFFSLGRLLRDAKGFGGVLRQCDQYLHTRSGRLAVEAPVIFALLYQPTASSKVADQRPADSILP